MTTTLIHQAGNYSVEKLGERHFVIYFEDDYTIKQVASYKNELSAVKRAEKENDK